MGVSNCCEQHPENDAFHAATFSGVGTFGGLRRSRSALARHLHCQRNQVGENAQEA